MFSSSHMHPTLLVTLTCNLSRPSISHEPDPIADADEHDPLAFKKTTEEERLATPSIFDWPQPKSANYYRRVKRYSFPSLKFRAHTVLRTEIHQLPLQVGSRS
jgi:hypothetical protein